MLSVISLSLAVAGYRIDLTRLLSSKILSATLWNNNLVDFSPTEQSLPLSSMQTFFSFYSDPCNLSFFSFFLIDSYACIFHRQFFIYFSCFILSYFTNKSDILSTSHKYDAYLVINGKYSELSALLAKFLWQHYPLKRLLHLKQYLE